MSGDDSSLSLRAPVRETVFRPFPLATPSGALYIERMSFLRHCINQPIHYLRLYRSIYSNKRGSVQSVLTVWCIRTLWTQIFFFPMWRINFPRRIPSSFPLEDSLEVISCPHCASVQTQRQAGRLISTLSTLLLLALDL